MNLGVQKGIYAISYDVHFISSGVVVTGNETPLIVGFSRDLTCTAVNIDVARIEWRIFLFGLDITLSSATGVNELIFTPNPQQVGTQMFRCVVKSTTGATYTQDAPVTIIG